VFAGIDFGTSNSSIAIFGGEKMRMFDLDPRNLNSRVLPSFTFVTKDHSTSVGIEAVENYLELETGRPSVWEKSRAGQMEITVGGPGSPKLWRYTGSSAIPAFIDLLSKRFDREKIKEMNPDTSIVGGLAIKAHELALH
jgi:molecular chaperone DnaK (HSP70)